MLGTNKIEKQDLAQENLRVNSMFYTIQGEGPFAGLPSVFIRLAGCNLKCSWCDSEFDTGIYFSPDEVVERILHVKGGNTFPRLVVITGGEPMLQNLLPLLALLYPHCMTQIETAGTVWIYGIDKFIAHSRLAIVCSPKTPKIHDSIHQHCQDYKYIVEEGKVDGEGFPNVCTQTGKTPFAIARPKYGGNVWIQPCDSRDPELNKANQNFAVDIVMKHGYRLSLQQHKILGLE